MIQYPKRHLVVAGVHPNFDWSTPMGSVNVRMERAVAKLDELRAAWASADVQTAITVADYNSLTGNVYAARIVYLRDPRLEQFAWLTSELTHHLRSALDAFVWANATRGGRQPLKPKSIQFPISPSRGHWRNATSALRHEIEPWLLDRLEVVQPMHEDTPRNSPVFILGEINNQDKHRLPILAAAAANEARLAFSYERVDPQLPEQADVTTKWSDQPLQEGLEVLSVETVAGYRVHGSAPNVTAELYLDVPGGKRPALEFLELLVSDVAGRLEFVRTGRRPNPRATP